MKNKDTFIDTLYSKLILIPHLSIQLIQNKYNKINYEYKLARINTRTLNTVHIFM